MKTVIVGAGPVGTVAALALADRGHEVTVVERDPEPPSVAAQRRGVMQFHHPHFFRPQIRQVLDSLAPSAWDAIIAAGGQPAVIDGMPPGISGLACRRAVFEQALRVALGNDARITLRFGTAAEITTSGNQVNGVVVDGELIDADLVLSCAGRSSTLGDEWREPAEGGPCGYSYVSRMYRTLDGSDPFGDHFPVDGYGPNYLAIVFPQDDSTLSALFIRRTGDRGLAAVQNNEAFDTVVAMIPTLATWTDPQRFTPITDVFKGGLLTNLYRRQVRDGTPSGVIFVGDAVCTTSPMAGRGGAIGLQQVEALVRLLDTCCVDEARDNFERWCDENVKPWFDDHVHWDDSLMRRWAGEDIDIDGPLSSDLICAAAHEEPDLAPVAMAFGGMMVPPAALRDLEEPAREKLRSGWRPAVAGPTREELIAAIS